MNSTFEVKLDYFGRLWLEADFGSGGASWGPYRVTIGNSSASLSATIELPDDIRKQLATELIAKSDQDLPVHWQAISNELHWVLQNVEQLLRTGAARVDEELRRSAGALRLPRYSFPRRPLNQSGAWVSVYWRFTDENRAEFKDAIESVSAARRRAISRGVMMPLLSVHEGRHVHLSDQALVDIRNGLESADPIAPSYALFGSAWSNYERRSFDTATVILAASIETALKWHLTEAGDAIVGFLIKTTASPALRLLAGACRDHGALPIPESFDRWLHELAEDRNAVVHKPVGRTPDPIQLARWFAVGEAILKLVAGYSVDALVGSEVAIISRSTGQPSGVHGLVLRREPTYGEDNYHVILESGLTRRFAPTDLATPARKQRRLDYRKS